MVVVSGRMLYFVTPAGNSGGSDVQLRPAYVECAILLDSYFCGAYGHCAVTVLTRASKTFTIFNGFVLRGSPMFC